MRSLVFPDRVILNARQPLVRLFRSGHVEFRSGTSTWVRLSRKAGQQKKQELIARLLREVILVSERCLTQTISEKHRS